MLTLSSLLVQRGVASMRAVEEAIARQVLHGGDLATSVLELGSVAEAALTPLLAESLGLEPAVGRLGPASREALRALPADLAVQHGVFPLDLRRGAPGGDVLVVATSEPLAAAVEEDLGFALGASLQQVAAPLVRIRQAQAEHYGAPLERRLAQLAARLEERADPSRGTKRPPADSGAPAPQTLPSSTASDTPDVPPPRPTLRGLSVGPALAALEESTARGLSVEPELEEPAAPAEPAPPYVPTLPAPAPVSPLPDETTLLSAVAVLAPPPEPPTLVPPGESTPPPPPAAPAPAAPVRGGARVLSGWVKRALGHEGAPGEAAPEPSPVEEPRRAAPVAIPAAPALPARSLSPSPQPRGRRKGPFTVAMAEEELARAETTEAVLDVVFDFAQQYFVFSALFAVQGDAAQGRRAAGRGAQAAQVAGIRVALDAPGALTSAREMGAPRVAPLGRAGADADLARALGRPSAGVAAAVIPVAVRTRVVALIYGDDGEDPVELGQIGEVIALAGLASPALERVILRKKLSKQGGSIPAPPLPPAVREMPAGAEGAERGDARASEPPGHGPISARTRAALLELTGRRRSDPDLSDAERTQPLHAQLPPPMDDGLPDLVVGPDASHDSTDPQGSFDAVARAFGLRGTGVEMGPDSVNLVSRAMRQGAVQPVVEAPWRPQPAAPAAARRAGLSDLGTAPTVEMPAPRDLALPPEPQESAPRGRATEVMHAAWTPGGALDRQAPGEAGAAARREGRADIGSSRSGAAHDHAALIQAVIDSGIDAGRAFNELLRHGEAAMKVIAARFPGPLWVDERVRELLTGPRHQEAIAQLPAASHCGPLLELVIAIGRPALPFMTVRAASPDPEVRFWATHVLGELRYPEAANALLPRLFDDDAAVRRVARRAAAALVTEPPQPGHPGGGSPPPDGARTQTIGAGGPLLLGLEYILRNPDESLPRRLLAMETAASIRAEALTPALIAALEDSHEFLAEAAERALVTITGQDFGRDAHVWRVWWASEGQHRPH